MNRDKEPNVNGDSVHWEYFINHNKAASPQFDDLCRGLASVIVRRNLLHKHMHEY